MNWGQVILPGKCPVTNDRENHQPSMLSRLKAQNTWWFSLTDRDVDETSEDKFHSLLGNSHQIRITIYIPFARDMLVTGLGDTTILPKPPSIPISHEVPVPFCILPGFAAMEDDPSGFARHWNGPSTAKVRVMKRAKSKMPFKLKTSGCQLIFPKLSSPKTFGVDRHLLGKKNNCKVCILQTLGLWSQIFWDFLRFLVRKGKSSTSIISGTAVIPSDSIQWHLAAAQFCHSIGNHDDTSRYFDIGFWVIFLRNLWKIWDLQSRWERNGFVPPQLASMLQAQSQAPMGHAKSWPKNLMVGPLKPQETWCQKPKFSLTYTGTPLEAEKFGKAYDDVLIYAHLFHPFLPLHHCIFSCSTQYWIHRAWTVGQSRATVHSQSRLVTVLASDAGNPNHVEVKG